MPLITWTDRLSVGIPAIDSQHRTLVDMINQLHEAHRRGEGRAVLDDILAAMADYARLHFRDEEALMAAAGYPKLAEHKRLHEEFGTRLIVLQARQRRSTPVGLSLEVMSFLREWLVEHIEGVDKHYVPHLAPAPRR